MSRDLHPAHAMQRLLMNKGHGRQFDAQEWLGDPCAGFGLFCEREDQARLFRQKHDWKERESSVFLQEFFSLEMFNRQNNNMVGEKKNGEGTSPSLAPIAASGGPPLKGPLPCGKGESWSASHQLNSSPPIHAANTGSSSKRKEPIMRYRRDRVIGAGGDGKVFLAVDLRTNEQVAIKEILIADERGKLENSREQMATAKKQIEMLQSLPVHPNVVQHRDAELTSCALNIVMEYVPGGSIASLLAKLGPFKEKPIREYARHICTGLEFLHCHGIIHRDIKGANCLVGLDGVAKVADFGCCISSSLCETQGTKIGVFGTSMWMSPECVSATGVTEKTDIWSLGCTIVEMATGRAPWHEAHFTNEWAALFFISQSGRGPPVPDHLSRQAHRFLQRCFSIDPAKRPTASECLRDPFLVEDYDDSPSAGPEMLPPSPRELSPPHSFPVSAESAQSNTEEAPEKEYATSTYSSVSFAVYDADWGQTVQADTTANPDDQLDDADALPLLKLANEPPPATHEPAAPPPNDNTPISCRAVSKEAIEQYVRQSIVVGEHFGMDDQLGFGLPEPILFNVMCFMDAKGLLTVGAASKRLQNFADLGAKEALWKRLFLKDFGDVDAVRMMLRRSWKDYYRDSWRRRRCTIDGRYAVKRRMCHSTNVFEGVDNSTGEAVAVKFEGPFGRSNRGASRASSSFGLSDHQVGATAPTDNTSSPPRGDGNTVKTPIKLRSAPQSGSSPGSVTSTPNKRPQGRNQQRLVSLQVPNFPQPPVLPPMQHSPFVLHPGSSQQPTPLATPSKRRVPPRRNAQSSPVRSERGERKNPFGALMNVTCLPTTFTFFPVNVDLSPAHAQPPSACGAGAPDAGSTSLGGTLPSGGSTVRGAAQPLANAPTVTVHEDVSPSRHGASWSELYEYERSETKPNPRRQRSALLQHYKVSRHLEAMGLTCIPRTLHYLESDADGASALVSSCLGPNLHELVSYCGNQLSIRTVALLALHLLDDLQAVHELGAVHGGLAPTSICVGTGEHHREVYLLNFTHAYYFRNPRTHRPVATSTPTAGFGNIRGKSQEYLSFCSTFIQRGCTPGAP